MATKKSSTKKSCPKCKATKLIIKAGKLVTCDKCCGTGVDR